MDTYDDFVGARRSALIEEFGGGAAAEAAVDAALARCRRGWVRLEQTTDVESHVRELVRDELDRPRRRRLTIYALVALALVVTGVVVISLLPTPPEVREEPNPVPVPWFAEGQLHLSEVVVTLPGAGSFAPLADGVVIEDEDGSLLLVEADGDVSDYDGEMPEVAEPQVPAPYDDGGDVSRRLAVAVAPSGEIVHLMEIAAAGPEAGVYARLSETISRMFVVCATPQCTTQTRFVVEGRDVRLR
ncbi:MAG: hypothetical protein JWN68_928 [Nocardioides sp.]|jgi:hypothetical protein|uniref:hypothetical protein n=1 Tax=Nocardioides sp. TaxID=35761 RepID=UPI00260E30A5|nr:hypothetical protein [Nocardioides sp.]MCW2832975.1 hypothetical protein [Nocardioides sp.]